MLTTANGLRDKGHKVHFVGRRNGEFIRRCAENGFPVFPMTLGGDFDPRIILRLARYFWKYRIDVVIGNFNKDCQLASLARRISPVKAVVARNGLPIVPNSLRYRLTYQLMVNGVITNTEAIKRRYMSYGWMREDLVKVIHNGVTLPSIEQFNREKICRQFNLPADKTLIGIFGRLVPQKQHHLFIEIAGKLLPEYNNLHFLVVGEGPLKNEIVNLVQSRGIDGYFTFTGHLSNPYPLHYVNNLLLLPSDDEGMPNVVMEAMGMKTPVVAFDVGGVRELIPSPELGKVVPRNDLSGMLKEARYYLDSPAIAQKTAEMARKWILEEFSVPKMLNEVEAYLLSFVNG